MAEPVNVQPLSAASARWECPETAFTVEPDAVPEELQERAVKAIRFGIEAGQDFHMVAVGESTVDIHRYLTWLLQTAAEDMPPCCDWCYVMNFNNPNQPTAFRLPTGRGRAFRAAMEQVIEDLRTDVPRAFQSEPYEERRREFLEQFGQQRDQAFEGLQNRAKELGFTITQSPTGIGIAPVLGGQPVPPESYAALEPDIKERFESGREALSRDLEQTMRTVRDLEAQLRDSLRELDKRIATEIVSHHFSRITAEYEEFPNAAHYLQAAQADIIQNINVFRDPGGGDSPPGVPAAFALEEFLRRYQINLIIDHNGESHPDVVYEDNPTYGNLIGRIERRGVLGTLVTDFTMIKPGALLKANEGFIVLELYDLLRSPLAWEALKRALTERSVRIEDPGQMMGGIPATSLEPAPVLLDVKVVLTGDARTVNLLSMADPDFDRLFKVRAEFHGSVDRNDAMIQALASFLAALEAGERPRLDASGISKLLEHSARLAGDQRRLSTSLQVLSDIGREAMQIAAGDGQTSAGGDAVLAALEARRYRARYTAERLRSMQVEGTLMIDTEGAVVGQINGLTVMSTPGYAYGAPVRITARAYAGRGGIVDIEREVELGGPIHSKGVFILNGYVGGKYGRERPLSLTASLVFEQSYSPVEGDSASLAELCALLSSLTELPLRQGLAITGSVNQHGDVQAIGGVNEKIEGFFDLCRERGLTGDQGVVFPHANVRNLMLREDVVEAVEQGRFFLYPVMNVDEVMSLFTGIPAGEADAEGAFPPDSIHGLVAARLDEFADHSTGSRARA